MAIPQREKNFIPLPCLSAEPEGDGPGLREVWCWQRWPDLAGRPHAASKSCTDERCGDPSRQDNAGCRRPRQQLHRLGEIHGDQPERRRGGNSSGISVLWPGLRREDQCRGPSDGNGVSRGELLSRGLQEDD